MVRMTYKETTGVSLLQDDDDSSTTCDVPSLPGAPKLQYGTNASEEEKSRGDSSLPASLYG